jgi:unsaturated rhamnogalacturonyl hydrolase
MRKICRTWKTLLAIGLITAFLGTLDNACYSQEAAKKEPVASPGDQPDDPGPLATNLSPALRSRDIRAAMRMVADWQLKQIQKQPPSRDWDYGTLYIGLLAASRTLSDPRYSQHVASVGEHYNWELTPLAPYAPGNDYAIGQAFLELYSSSHKEAQIAPLRRRFNDSLTVPDDPAHPVWWWCDALFMQPAAGTELSRVRGDPRYGQYIDREWVINEKLLYDQQKHLFSRDVTFLDKKEKNGEKIFWSRGNGWVMGGIVRVLATLPPDSPSRSHYVDLLHEMAAEVASIQGSDGLWRPGLLDAQNYPFPEVSGSAFFTYALTWGINHKLLDAKVYRPVVEKAWRGMLTHIYQDGRLGSIQPIGAAPDVYKADSSYVFGVGAFLLAGSELDAMAQHKNH